MYEGERQSGEIHLNDDDVRSLLKFLLAGSLLVTKRHSTFPSLSSAQFPISTPVAYFCSILQPGSCHFGSPKPLCIVQVVMRCLAFNIAFLWLQRYCSVYLEDNFTSLRRFPGEVPVEEGGKMSSRSEKEKALEKAMRRLTPVFMRKLSPDVRHELYGRDQLTWMEYERIGTSPL